MCFISMCTSNHRGPWPNVTTWLRFLFQFFGELPWKSSFSQTIRGWSWLDDPWSQDSLLQWASRLVDLDFLGLLKKNPTKSSKWKELQRDLSPITALAFRCYGASFTPLRWRWLCVCWALKSDDILGGNHQFLMGCLTKNPVFLK